MSKINKKSIGITYTNAEIEKYIRGRDKLTILNKAMKKYDIGLQRGYLFLDDKVIDYYVEEKGNFINILKINKLIWRLKECYQL